MRHYVASFVLLSVAALFANETALGFTPAEIDAAAKAAKRVGGLTRRLASDKFQGRNNDTPGSLEAQKLLIRQLRRLGDGLNTAATGDDAYRQPFVQSGSIGTNLLAVIPGSELPNEYVIVGGHYDHLTSCPSVQPGDTVCNGATDNASGSAVVVAIGRAIRALPHPPRRSVVLALWDAEEDGLRGSLYYVGNPLVPLAQTVAYVNFDIQGANLLPSLRNRSFAVGPETGGTTLKNIVSQAVAAQTLDTRQLSYIFGQGRSDYLNFINSAVPTVFFSDSTGGCYHTNGDERSIVNYDKLKEQGQIGFRVVVDLAETATPPTFAPLATPATYDDAVVINDTITAGLADLALFSPADQTLIQNAQATLSAIVADGPGAFDPADVSTLLLTTIDLVEVLTRVPCQRF